MKIIAKRLSDLITELFQHPRLPGMGSFPTDSHLMLLWGELFLLMGAISHLLCELTACFGGTVHHADDRMARFNPVVTLVLVGACLYVLGYSMVLASQLIDHRKAKQQSSSVQSSEQAQDELALQRLDDDGCPNHGDM